LAHTIASLVGRATRKAKEGHRLNGQSWVYQEGSKPDEAHVMVEESSQSGKRL
jgi:hypothetical protein